MMNVQMLNSTPHIRYILEPKDIKEIIAEKYNIPIDNINLAIDFSLKPYAEFFINKEDKNENK